jgi:hypothetical protein
MIQAESCSTFHCSVRIALASAAEARFFAIAHLSDLKVRVLNLKNSLNLTGSFGSILGECSNEIRGLTRYCLASRVLRRLLPTERKQGKFRFHLKHYILVG